ncbi:MAG TPA: thioredoxin domain-containing protein [Pyrinomonadaceae bacterium]|nr:thioredoxin domain-containing protein [Pyrinomonadaceae bacterium]
MANQPQKKSSVAPLVIIGIVLAAAVGGFYMLYSTSKSPVANNSTASGNRTSTSSTPRTQPTVPANAPAGAAPVYAIGPPSASVTIEEFADFQCPACASTHPAMKEVQGAYAGNKNVRFVFRNFPLSMHDKSMDAAAAVEAAGMQGQPKFWAMMDQMFNNQQAWANAPNYKEIWKGYAEKIGLNVQQWENDASGMATRGRIELDLARGRAVGVGSTPTIYINGRAITLAEANLATMKQLIDAEIASTAAGAAPAPSATVNAGGTTKSAETTAPVANTKINK